MLWLTSVPRHPSLQTGARVRSTFVLPSEEAWDALAAEVMAVRKKPLTDTQINALLAYLWSGVDVADVSDGMNRFSRSCVMGGVGRAVAWAGLPTVCNHQGTSLLSPLLRLIVVAGYRQGHSHQDGPGAGGPKGTEGHLPQGHWCHACVCV